MFPTIVEGEIVVKEFDS